jgi:hypothetical protein
VTTQTISVTVNSDVLDEPDEAFFINLSNPIQAGIQDPTSIGLIVDDDLPSPLHVLGGPAAGGENVDALSYASVQPLLAVAIEQWRAAGADPLRLNGLDRLSVQITDLSDSTLGLASQDLILLDRDAAGYGWSLDIWPQATAAGGRVDLLSVLAHELGHILNFGHDVMAEALGVGERRLPLSERVPERGSNSPSRLDALDEIDAWWFEGGVSDTTRHLAEAAARAPRLNRESDRTADLLLDTESLEGLATDDGANEAGEATRRVDRALACWGLRKDHRGAVKEDLDDSLIEDDLLAAIIRPKAF